MADLIDRHETLKAFPPMPLQYAAIVCEVLENAPAVNRLIPCSKQLPDKDGKYLVLQRDRFEILEYRTELKQFGYTYEDEDEPGYPYTEWAEMLNVTHWMPLPDKPEDLNHG